MLAPGHLFRTETEPWSRPNMPQQASSLSCPPFGSTETPTSSGLDPIGAATAMGNWVRQYDLDGIDVDYEVKKPCFFLQPMFG